MNLHDSERVAGVLDACGCVPVGTPEEADIVVFMTCCVREKADTHLYGQASAMASAPTPPSGRRVVAIGGCIAQRDGERLRAKVPCVDVVFGTSAISELPALIDKVLASDAADPAVDTQEEGRGFATELPTHREQAFHAWVPIMSGCDNFCSYCIVPHVRGRERSRDFERIVEECRHLVGEGVREICLLGQNVNSYGSTLYGKPRFAELLRAVGETGIERLRFTSSNPKDLNDDVIAAMAETPAVMPHLHLAVQSGSTRVLKAMNRSYTREEYLDLARRLRAAMPDLALSTDVIVGFPGESEEDFEDTLSLMEEVHFSSAYTFIFSPRQGTPAAEMVDDTPREVIQERFDRLAHLVEDLAFEANQPFAGQIVESLVEGTSKKDASILVGHSPRNQTVLFPVPAGRVADEFVGRLCDVRVEQARTWYLRGELVGDAH
jgi:tRNA-2-methylthio-N6-dimethylallyladenosine synthase